MRIFLLATTLTLSTLLRCSLLGAIGPGTASRPLSYRIKGGDGLLVVVTAVGGASRYVRVSPRGKIRLPAVGELSVAGKTADEAVKIIERAFRRTVKDTGVTVDVIKSGSSARSAGNTRDVLLFGARFTRPVTYEENLRLEDVLK